MLTLKVKNNDLYIYGTKNFDLSQTLDCGQAFRWESEDGKLWKGVAFEKYLELYRDSDAVVFKNTSLSDYQNFWKNYFDLDRNYSEIIEKVKQNEVIAKSIEYAGGIRILNQNPWEGIIDRLCENFGEKKDGYYTFPTAQKLANLNLEDLDILRAGFRSKYIIDAARKVTDGTINLEELRKIPYESALEKLMIINGVGPKVADCALLFGLGHIEAFPKDVWIKRAMEKLFNGDLPECAVPYAGIVQQYIFHYARITKLSL